MSDRPIALSVVHLLAPAPFGGLESVVETLAAGQRDAGVAVHVAAVLSNAGRDHPFVAALEARGLPVTILQVGGRQYLEERNAVASLLSRTGATVLHTHGYRPDVIDAPVARRMRVATVTTVHGFTGGGGVKGRLYEWLQKRAFRSFDAVIAVSGKLRGELVAAGVREDRVHAVRNAWSPAGEYAERSEARRALGIPEDAKVVGWVGRMSQEKAPDVVVRAFAAAGPGLRLSLIGSGPLEEECRALTASLGVADRVTWHGAVPRAGPLLKAFDMIALTSWTEGTPMVLLEAMGAGVPIVTTAVGGIPESVGPSEAQLVQAGDVAGLAAALDAVLRDAPAAAARAASAQRRAETELAVGSWVERHREVYAEAMAGRLRAR
ncbi:MAG: glycosyltransferase [Longimicrobiales bacterium]